MKMQDDEILATFLEQVPAEYSRHMFCFFESNAARGVVFLFKSALLSAVQTVDYVCAGYARKMLMRIGAIRDTGKDQHDALLSILAEIFVTVGFLQKADRDGDTVLLTQNCSPL